MKQSEVEGDAESAAYDLRIIAVSEYDDLDKGKQLTIFFGEGELRLCEVYFAADLLESGLELQSEKRSASNFSAQCYWDGDLFVQSVNHNTKATFTVTGWDSDKREGAITVDLRLVTPELEPQADYLKVTGSNLKVSTADWR